MGNVFNDRMILVADDEEDIREYVERVQESISPNVDILTAADGEEALKLIRECVPDLVILDLKMPKMNGYAVLAELRKDERTRFVPVLILTGFAGGDVEADVLDMGADGFITKPISRMVLVAQVVALLRVKSNYDALASRAQATEKELAAFANRVESVIGAAEVQRLRTSPISDGNEDPDATDVRLSEDLNVRRGDE